MYCSHLTPNIVKKISKDKLTIQNLKAERTLYSSLFIASQARGADMESFFEHENHTYPVSISQFGTSHPSKKSDVLEIFGNIVSPCYQPPTSDVEIVDGAVMVQAYHPKASTTYGQYCFQEFPSKMFSIFKTSKVVCHFVFDQYCEGSKNNQLETLEE